MLAQQVVEHPQKLQHSLLSSGVSKARVVDDKIGVDLAVVPADVESSGEQFVMNILCDMQQRLSKGTRYTLLQPHALRQSQLWA